MIACLMKRALRREDGAGALEFALVAGPLFVLLTGVFEVALVTFASTAVENAALTAARFGSTGRSPEDGTRLEEVRRIIEDDTFGLIDPERLSIDVVVYDSFGEIGKPEPITGDDGDGVIEPGEINDLNGNGQWDEDRGSNGPGKPEEFVVYRVVYNWKAMTPLIRPLLGEVPLEAVVPVRNEPFEL